MNFDLRLPLGLIFTLFGGMLTVFGAISDNSAANRPLGINLNLDWGAFILLFGVWMLSMAIKARSKRKSH